MKKQIKKQNKIDQGKGINKTAALKWITMSIGLLIVLAWIAWFACDCYFVSKGIHIDWEWKKVPIVEWDYIVINDWYWVQTWYQICNKLATTTLALSGGYVVLQLAYIVICGLNIKRNIKYYIYQLIITTASFITITICIIEAARMMVGDKWILDISFFPPGANIYHLDYLKWMSIVFGCVIFTNVLMFTSSKDFERHSIIKDTNVLTIVLAAGSITLFVPFTISLGFNDKFVGGAETLEQWLVLAQNSITWKHIVSQCVTMPMGVLAGMVMVLQVIRLITVMFVYNKRWGEKKSHIIIFSIITFITFTAFIIAHAQKLDFVRLINKYDEIKTAILIVMICQTTGCLGAGIYCALSQSNYKKRINI